jgi:hypothetical protein
MGPFHRPPHPLPNGYLYSSKRVELPQPGSVQSALVCASMEFKHELNPGGMGEEKKIITSSRGVDYIPLPIHTASSERCVRA